jgi:hypothetical protein
MMRRGLMLLLLAALLAGSAPGEGDTKGDMTIIPASQDVYISMGENKVSVFNQTETLLCALNVADGNKTEATSYPGAPVIQFNISGLNITDNDVAVLVLRAASMQTQGDPVMVALMSIGSDWDESSDYTTFLVNILPAWNIIEKNDAAAMSSNTDGDSIFAFDVSQKLRNSGEEGDKISFLLEAISNSSAEISFLPRESGQGPCLMIMPYPEFSAEADMQPDSALNSSLLADQTAALLENTSQIKMQADMPSDLQTIPAGEKALVAGRMLSKQSLE